MVFIFVPIMTIVCRMINRKMRSAFGQQRYQIGELNAKIEDSLLGQKVVKAFTNEELEKEKFEEGNQEFLKIKTYTYMLMGMFNTSTRVFDGLMYLVVILGGWIFPYGTADSARRYGSVCHVCIYTDCYNPQNH